MAKMHIYELKEGAGPHKMRGEDEDGNPINESMEPGQRVKSTKPLDRLHPNKFTRIDNKREKINDRGPLTEPVRPSKPNRGNSRLDGDPTDEDDEKDQVELFEPDVDHETDEDEEDEVRAKKKAKAVPKKNKATNKEGIHDDSKEPEFEDDEEDEGIEKYGKDVSEDIEGAKEKDLKVFQKKNGKKSEFFLFDADEPDPLTDKPLVSKAAVDKFIHDYKG